MGKLIEANDKFKNRRIRNKLSVKKGKMTLMDTYGKGEKFYNDVNKLKASLDRVNRLMLELRKLKERENGTKSE